jgi:hypothetical protein
MGCVVKPLQLTLIHPSNNQEYCSAAYVAVRAPSQITPLQRLKRSKAGVLARQQSIGEHYQTMTYTWRLIMILLCLRLGLYAFNEILSRKPTAYTLLLRDIRLAMRSPPYERTRRRLQSLVKRHEHDLDSIKW